MFALLDGAKLVESYLESIAVSRHLSCSVLGIRELCLNFREEGNGRACVIRCHAHQSSIGLQNFFLFVTVSPRLPKFFRVYILLLGEFNYTTMKSSDIVSSHFIPTILGLLKENSNKLFGVLHVNRM